jgi:predicted nucleic acid-binding protein
LVWEGTLYPLIDAAVDGKVQLFTSPALLTELRRILGKNMLPQNSVVKIIPPTKSSPSIANLLNWFTQTLYPE